MAQGVTASFDISDLEQAFKRAEKQAALLDSRLANMVKNSAQLQKNMEGAFSGSLGNILDRVQDDMAKVFQTKLTPDVDTTKMDKLVSLMNEVVVEMKTLGSISGRTGVELFDTQNVYTTTESVKELNKQLSNTIDEIQKKEQLLGSNAPYGLINQIPVTAKDAFISQLGGREFDEEEFAMFRQAHENEAFIKEELRILQEQKKIIEAKLKWAKKTEDERIAYLKKLLDNMLTLEQSHIGKIRTEYKNLSQEIFDITKQRANIEKNNKDFRLDDEISTLDIQLEERNKRRLELEQKYSEMLFDLVEKNERKVIDLKSKNLKAEDILEQQMIKEYRSTPQGAFEFALSAETTNEMKEAMDYIEIALGNIKHNTAEAKDENEKLVAKYSELKTAVEEWEGKTKDMNTLVATEASKYARLIEEMHKYGKSLKQVKESEAFLKGDSKAVQDAEALEQYIVVLNERKKAYDLHAESIIAAERKVNAKIAQDNIIAREQEEAKKAEIARKYAGMSPKEAERAISDSGIAAIEREQKAIEHLIEAKHNLDSTNEHYVAQIKQYDEWISKHKSNLDKLTEAYKKQEEEKKKYAKTPQGALQSAREAKSVQDLINAYKNLDAARKGVDVSTKDGKKAYKDSGKEMERVQRELDKYGTAVSGVNTKHRELLHTGEQLRRALTGIFSISAIRGYINKLMEVRGEFELQNRSLQALLQNKDEADKLWDKTIQLAIRSPYRIKELVTYTKQLAAYRVESDKLYDTTKMLADISAGLGVDMQRLILAYGQVKAANYLRGTELRQFSEAGINVLGELSKYFTELEGRAVSVGDVFERVSKRMVSFADVEEVLQRATGEGGIFYNMQEIQAETLGAQRKNLTDSLEVMINEIGEDMEDSLKGSMKAIREVIGNWRDFVPVVKSLVAVLVSYKAIQAVVALGNTRLGRTFKILATDAGRASLMMSNLGKNLLSFGGSLLRGGIIGGIIALVGWLAKLAIESNKAERAAKQLRKDLDKLYDKDTANLDKQISRFEDLVRRLGETAEGTKEYKDIISQINSQYGEYLGFLADENTAYEKIAGSVDKVVYSLTQKARANTLEKAHQKTSDSYLDRINDEREEITEWFEGGKIKIKGEDGKLGTLIPSKSELEAFFRFIEKKSKESERDSYNWGDAKTWFKDFFGGEVIGVGNILEQSFAKLKNSYRGLDVALKNLEEDLDSVYTAGVYGTAEYLNAMKEFEAGIPELRDELATDMFPVYDKEGNKIKNYFKNLAEPQQEAIQKEIESRKLTIKFTYELTPEEGAVTDAVENAMGEWDKHSDVIKKFNDKISKKLAGKDKLVINAVYQEQETANTKSANQLLEEFVNGYKKQEEEIKFLNGLKKEGAVYSEEERTELEKQLATAEDLKTAYYEAVKLLGGLDLLPENRKQFDDFKKRISLIEEMRKKYEELRRSFSRETALKQVQRDYGDAWESVGGRRWKIPTIGLESLEDTAIYIEQELIPLIKELPKTYQKEATQIATKSAAGLRVMLGVDEKKINDNALKRDVENLFENYEFSIDLKKLNVPSDLAKQLFGLETIDLKTLGERLKKMAPQFVGTPMEEYYQQQLKKVADMEDKARHDSLKKYIEYTRDAIGERAKIKIEELNKLREIEENFEDGLTKDRAIAGVRKEAQDELNKYEWEQFRSSDLFASIFDDLSEASATSIQYAIEQIKKYKEEWTDMPVTEAKEMIEKLNELELALLQIGKPSDGIKKLTQELEKAMGSRSIKSNSRYAYANLREELEKENVEREKANKAYKDEIAELEVLAQLYAEKKLVVSELSNEQRQLLGIIDETSMVEEAVIIDGIAHRKELVQANDSATNSANELLEKNKALVALYQAQQTQQEKWIELAGNLSSAVRDLASAFVELDEQSTIWWDLGDQMISLTSQAVQYWYQLEILEVQSKATGIAMNTALGPVGWAVMAIQAIAAVVKAVADVRQAKVDAKIEEQKNVIVDLQKEYEKLQKSIEEAYSIEEVSRYNKEIQKNLEATKKAAAEAKAAAESGKNNEKNRQEAEEAQEQYDKAIEDAAEHAKQVFSEMTSGIFDNSISAAEGFIDAWLDAYQEVGDGMSGLTTHLEEEMMNVAKRQAAYQIVGQFTNMWKNQLDEAMGDDLKLSGETLAKYIDTVKESIPGLNDALEEFYEAMPFTNTGELSGLQKGIQGITAEQADVLAAYWNSVRFLMSSIDQKFDVPLSNFMSSDTTINPILNELRVIATQSNNIYKLLDGMTAVHDKGGRGIKVVM